MRDMINKQRLRSSARWGKKVWMGLCLIAMVWALTVQSVQAQSPYFADFIPLLTQYGAFNPDLTTGVLNLTTRAKATPDECWDGTPGGSAFQPGSGLLIPEDITEVACFPGSPTPVGLKKANHTYMWALAGEGNKLIYGTGANIGCTTAGGSLGATNPSTQNQGTQVCEYATSHLAVSQGGTVPDELGDWRPPQAYIYDVGSQTQINKTQSIKDGGCGDELNDTIGFRAAGAHKGWSFLAGSSLTGSTLTANASEKLYMYAWKPNGDFAGCHAFEQYNDGRKMVVVKGNLYFGVQNTPDSCQDPAAKKYTIGVKGGSATVRFKYESPNNYEWGYKTAFGQFQLVSTGPGMNKVFTETTDVTFVLRDKVTKQVYPLGEPINVNTYKDPKTLIRHTYLLAFKAPNGKEVVVTIPSPSESGGDYLAEAEDTTTSSLENLLGCGGSILRWTGYSSGNPFDWTVVGLTDAMVSNLAEHDGRLFAITWPQLATLANEGTMSTQTSSLSGVGDGVGGTTPLDGSGDLSQLVEPLLGLVRAFLTNPKLELGLFASLYMSPTIGTGGLTSAHREQWKKVWQSSQYDPDLIVSMTYGGGDLRSFDGYLWWGTMHLPGLATILFTSLDELGIVDHDTDGNGQIDGGNTGEAAVLQLGTNRFTSIHRGKYFGTKNQVIQVVYGNKHLPIYERDKKSYTYAEDAAHLNLTGQAPLRGLAGFGTSSFYTWTMEVFDYSLYIGTFALPLGNQFPNNPVGADLWRIDSKDDPAVVESLTAGDRSTWGIRSIAVLPGKLFLGTAGPVNLDRTHINPAFPKPGYQLIEGVVAP